MAAARPYRLGCMASLYSTLPLTDALSRIRKIGYRYAVPSRTHAEETVYAAGMPASKRTQVQQQFRDHGVEPFMAMGSAVGEVHHPGKLDECRAELDLAVSFGISIVIGTGPWYYRTFPNIPYTMREWEKELAAFRSGGLFCISDSLI